VASVELRGLTKRYGSAAVVDDVSLHIEHGHLVCLLGPSGCGKTTTLRLIAGFVEPSAGEIRVGDKLISSSAHTVPPERRQMSMIFQSYALWPHMTVAENIVYGLKLRKMSRDVIGKKLDAILATTKLAPLAERYPGELSGGQQQRVALARALIVEPETLLLDEPLSNLDAKLRADMRIELRDLQHRLGITSLYVTHDLEEALAMSDRIVVMRDGLVEQTGTPDEIYGLPRSEFVADFIGSANLIRGHHRVDLDGHGLIALETAGRQIIYGMAYGRPAGAELVVSVRTVHLQISLERPAETKNVWPVRVEKTVFQGDFSQVHIGWGDQRLIARCAAMEPIAPGREVYMAIEPRRVVLLGAGNS